MPAGPTTVPARVYSYWGHLLISGVITAAIAGGLLVHYIQDTTTSAFDDLGTASTTVHPSSAYLIFGLVLAVMAQILLGGGIVGLGVSSAGHRPVLEGLMSCTDATERHLAELVALGRVAAVRDEAAIARSTAPPRPRKASSGGS